MALQIRKHFGSDRFCNVTGQAGIDMMFQRADVPDSPTSLRVNWQVECPIVIVAMIDDSFVQDAEWVGYIHALNTEVSTRGLNTNLLPVAMEPGILDKLELDQQFLRWDKWDSVDETCEQRLIRELGYEFARML